MPDGNPILQGVEAEGGLAPLLVKMTLTPLVSAMKQGLLMVLTVGLWCLVLLKQSQDHLQQQISTSRKQGMCLKQLQQTTLQSVFCISTKGN